MALAAPSQEPSHCMLLQLLPCCCQAWAGWSSVEHIACTRAPVYPSMRFYRLMRLHRPYVLALTQSCTTTATAAHSTAQPQPTAPPACGIWPPTRSCSSLTPQERQPFAAPTTPHGASWPAGTTPDACASSTWRRRRLCRSSSSTGPQSQTSCVRPQGCCCSAWVSRWCCS